jgi:AcrR family transcriptional regulator
MTNARSVGRPRNEHADADILDAATQLLAQHGYTGVTMEAIAAEAGVAKSTVYRRWTNKDELIFDALSMIKGPVSIAPGDSVRGDLCYLMQAMSVSWAEGLHARLMRRLAADATDQPQRYRDFRARLIEPRHLVFRAVLDRGVEEGLIDSGVDLDWLIDLLVSPVVAAGLTHQPKLGRNRIEFILDAVLDGVAPI